MPTTFHPRALSYKYVPARQSENTKNKQCASTCAHETQCFSLSIDVKSFFEKLGITMSTEKKLIPVDNIHRMSAMLRDIAETADRAYRLLAENNSPGVLMDGWPTLAKAIQDAKTQVEKIAGPASSLHGLDPSSILLEGQTISGKKPKIKKPLEKLEAKVAKKRQQK